MVISRKLELHPHPLPQVKCTPITEGKMSVTSTTLPSCTSLLREVLSASMLLPATTTPMQQGSYLHIRATSLDIAPLTVIHPTGCSWHTKEGLLCLALEWLLYPRTMSGSGEPGIDCCHFHCKVTLHCYQWLRFYASFQED